MRKSIGTALRTMGCNDMLWVRSSIQRVVVKHEEIEMYSLFERSSSTSTETARDWVTDRWVLGELTSANEISQVFYTIE